MSRVRHQSTLSHVDPLGKEHRNLGPISDRLSCKGSPHTLSAPSLPFMNFHHSHCPNGEQGLEKERVRCGHNTTRDQCVPSVTMRQT